ncbi:MAG: Na/Pi cotransporter family protein [Solobacterium sp.]|nr:Na/Pi cotransporter family protein [Solobacterium sp.]
MSISNVLALFSGVALFLYGMTLMGDGLKKVAGNSLEVILYKLSSNPLKGIALGAGVTAVIQSSSATSVMVVGFVNSKMMKVKQAIGIIMGAIIGTSITGWIVSLSSIEGSSGILELLSTDSLTAIIAIIGIYLRMFCKHTRQKQIGDIMMGFAVLMFGMKAMSSSVSGLRNSEVFINMLTNFSNPLIGILVGALFTAVIQSASAAVGILQALSATGAITFEVAFPMLMGIAVGASLPVLLSALGASSDGKRSAFAYLLVDVLGAVIIGVLFYSLNMFMHFSFLEMSLNTVSIALLNTVYRVIMVLMLAPCIGLIEKICRIIVKDDEEEEELYEEDRLEERFIAHPALAIEQCRITINNMALITRDNICNACALLDGFSDKGFKKVEKKEDIIDRYADKLGTYMVKVTRKELNKQQNSEISKYLHTIEDFERIGDHGMNIAEAIRDLDQKKLGFTDEAKKELSSLVLAVEDMLTLTAEAFINNDLKLAYSIDPFESVVDDICEKLKLNHVERLKKGNCTIEAGIAFNDLITDLERIGDHCNNVFISMLEQEMDDYDMHQIKNTFTTDQIRDYNQLLETYKVKYSVESK